jgi:hypothetical protein
MKKMLVIIIFSLILHPVFCLQKGDSLAVLYMKVWAYEDPGDLSTRTGPYSYLGPRLVFLDTSMTYAGYYQVLTPDKKAAFIRKSRVSTDQTLTHQKILQAIKEGKSYDQTVENRDLSRIINFRSWITWVVVVALLAGFYFLWKYFLRIDRWFCRRGRRPSKPLKSPWFITFSILPGLIIGAMQNFISRTETNWFLNEGMRLWAHYPSFWDWILWGLFMFFFAVLLGGIGQSFFRFPPLKALIYALMTVVIGSLYFVFGIFTGGFAFIILVLYLYTKSQAGGKSSSGDPPNTIYRDGRTYEREPGTIDTWRQI